MIVRNCGDSCPDATYEEFPGTITFTGPATCRAKGGRSYRYFRTATFTPTFPEGNDLGVPAGPRSTVIRWAPRELNLNGCRR